MLLDRRKLPRTSNRPRRIPRLPLMTRFLPAPRDGLRSNKSGGGILVAHTRARAADGFQPVGHLHPKPVTHLIRRQCPHLKMRGIDLIEQHRPPLLCDLTAEELTHRTTLSNTHANHRPKTAGTAQPVDETSTGDNLPMALIRRPLAVVPLAAVAH